MREHINGGWVVHGWWVGEHIDSGWVVDGT